MIDMKQLLADREAGTQGPLFVGKNNPTSIYTQNGVFLAKTHSDYSREYMAEADARRFARVPELEQALIDARAALVQCKKLFALMIVQNHPGSRGSAHVMLAICEKGLGE